MTFYLVNILVLEKASFFPFGEVWACTLIDKMTGVKKIFNLSVRRLKNVAVKRPAARVGRGRGER